MGDIGAYTVGRLIGRHKMAPVLSPGKTYEGAVGGIVFRLRGAWLRPATGCCQRLRRIPVEAPGAGSGMACWSDSPECWGFGRIAAKARLGCKDSSPWMPGFGGVLDILDSFCWLRRSRMPAGGSV